MLEQAIKMWVQFLTNKVLHQNFLKKKQVTFQSNKSPAVQTTLNQINHEQLFG